MTQLRHGEPHQHVDGGVRCAPVKKHERTCGVSSSSRSPMSQVSRALMSLKKYGPCMRRVFVTWYTTLRRDFPSQPMDGPTSNQSMIKGIDPQRGLLRRDVFHFGSSAAHTCGVLALVGDDLPRLGVPRAYAWITSRLKRRSGI